MNVKALNSLRLNRGTNMMTSIRKAQLPLLSIMAVLCFMQHTANADTITFNPLELPGTGYTPIQTYTESGFTFTNLTSNDPDAFVSAQQGHPTDYAGSASLVNNWGDTGQRG